MLLRGSSHEGRISSKVSNTSYKAALRLRSNSIKELEEDVARKRREQVCLVARLRLRNPHQHIKCQPHTHKTRPLAKTCCLDMLQPVDGGPAAGAERAGECPHAEPRQAP